jgi:hypothetical protein
MRRRKKFQSQMNAGDNRDPTLSQRSLKRHDLSAFICVHLRLNLLACLFRRPIWSEW